MSIQEIRALQKNYFYSGKTLPYKFRITVLEKLKSRIIANENEIYAALYKDLGKTKSEAYMCEVGLVLSDLNYQMKHLKKFMKRKKVSTPLAQFKSKSYIQPVPYGLTLILSPWNYPILLTLGPLLGAIAAGNTAIIKPSEYAKETALVLKKIIEETFEPHHVAILLGDAKVAKVLLEYPFDYIFFTGGSHVGKLVYEAASKNLTPVTLELGGKSPVIIEETAKISLAAKRIIFGKYINCGQTCVAPDYILVPPQLKEELISQLIYWIRKLYPNGHLSKDYGKIINETHFNRLLSYLESEKILYGGLYSKAELKLEPTLLEANVDSKCMKEEIFGPILPILTYQTEKELFSILQSHPTPLALYIFSNNKKKIKEYTTQIQFGGGCINDTIVHLATNTLPFGGVGTSGIGSYHGKKSFDTFTHYKSILHKATWLDLSIRYAPYTKAKDKKIRKFLK